MKTTLTNPDSTCPVCGKQQDAATHLESAVPLEGDLSVCLYCGTLCQFTQDLKLEQCPQSVIDTLHPETKREYIRTREAIDLIRQQRGFVE